MGQNGRKLSGGSGSILPAFFKPRLVVVVKSQEFEADLFEIGPKTMKSLGKRVISQRRHLDYLRADSWITFHDPERNGEKKISHTFFPHIFFNT